MLKLLRLHTLYFASVCILHYVFNFLMLSVPIAVACDGESSSLIKGRLTYLIPAGLSVGHLGNSSIRYRMAIFKFLDEKQRLPLDAMEGYFASEAQQEGLLSKLNAQAVALGTFVHVTVDPRKQTPTKIPAKWRESLSVVLTS